MRQFDPNELDFIKRKYGTQAIKDIQSGKMEALGFTEDELLDGYDDYLNELKDTRKKSLNQRLNSKRKLIVKPQIILNPDIPQLVNIDINEDEIEQLTNRIKNLNLSDPGTQPYSEWDYGKDITQEEFMNGDFSDSSIMFRHYPPEQSEQNEESTPTAKPKLIQKKKNNKSKKSKKRNNKQEGVVKTQSKKNSGQAKKNNFSTSKLEVFPARIDTTNAVGYFTNPELQTRYIKIVKKSNHPNDYWYRPHLVEMDGGSYSGAGSGGEWK